MENKKRLSRRGFMKGAVALGATSAALGSMISRPRKARASTSAPIKIGHQCILSGVLGGYGKFMQMGANMAVEEINQAKGILGRKVEIEFRDSEVKPPVAVKNARYFIDDWKADFLTGIDSSGVALAVGKVMPELGKILIVTHGATEKYNENLVYKDGIKNIFRISVPVYQDSIAAAMIAKDFDVTRWACISPKYEYGYTTWKMFKATLKQFRKDVKFVAESWAPFGTQDFGPHISTVMAQKPDGIFTVEWAGEAIALVKQAKLFGVFDKVKAWMNGMGAAMDVMEGLGKDYPEGLWVSCRYWFQYPPTEFNNAFVERFHKKYNHYPHYSSETSYSVIYAIKKAAEKAGTIEPKEFIAAMEDMTMLTPAGRRWFRKADHQALYEVPWGQITHDPKYPMPVLKNQRVVPGELYYRSPPFPPVE